MSAVVAVASGLGVRDLGSSPDRGTDSVGMTSMSLAFIALTSFACVLIFVGVAVMYRLTGRTLLDPPNER